MIFRFAIIRFQLFLYKGEVRFFLASPFYFQERAINRKRLLVKYTGSFKLFCFSNCLAILLLRLIAHNLSYYLSTVQILLHHLKHSYHMLACISQQSYDTRIFCVILHYVRKTDYRLVASYQKRD
jgi:hypothetical protein